MGVSTLRRSKFERLIHIEHIGSGGLLLQQFELVEQRHVFDCYDGLSGKF
jgi:hypothetical protein